MIDIHHHLLYGLDDGSDDLETSISMARIAAEDGITHVVCTPHASHRYEFLPEENSARIALLRQELKANNIELTLGLGCDFHLTWDNIEEAKSNPGKFSINGTQYLLVELPDTFLNQGMSNSFAELMTSGLIPIVTHPERNQAIQRDPSRMVPWLQDGALVQVTAGAVLGRFGKTAEALAHQFLANGWVHVIATDAHDTKHRPPRMRECFDLVLATYGEATARRLCMDNPRLIFEGKPLGRQPLYRGIDDEGHVPPKRSWLKRILR